MTAATDNNNKDTMDWANTLNIVIAPPSTITETGHSHLPKSGGTKRKKNKYERRRRKAEIAKAEKNHQQQKQEKQQHDTKKLKESNAPASHAHLHPSNNDNASDDDNNDEDNDDQNNVTGSDLVEANKKRTDSIKGNSDNAHTTSSSDEEERDSDTSSDNIKTQTNEKETLSKIVSTNNSKQEKKEPSTPNTTVPQEEPSPVVSRRKASVPGMGADTASNSTSMTLTVEQLQQQQQEREDHAKYLAEFHARPMELDRRMGAIMSNNTSKNKSFDSQHLFQTQSKWNTLHLHPRLVQTLTNHSSFQLSQPTTIQTKAIQAIWKGNDDNDGNNDNNSGSHKTETRPKSNKDHTTTPSNFLLHSETGSGKTLAYALPIVQSLASTTSGTTSKNRKQLGTRCLILCPTRELATQTLHVLEQLCTQTFVWLVPGGLTGGGDTRKSEKARLRKGLPIIVSTPGRLLDHLSKTEALLLALKGKLEWLVLDEADRLLDMGLGDQVRQIVQRLRANDAPSSSSGSSSPHHHHTQQHHHHEPHRWRSILVSATVTPAVQALAKERMLCGDRDWVWIKNDGPKGTTTETEEMEETTPVHPNQNNNNHKEATMEETEQGGYSFSESTPRQLTQFHLTVSAKLRLASLVSFLVQRIHQKERVVVFLSTCASVDYHYQLLRAMDSILSSASSSTSNKNNSDNKEEQPQGIFDKQGTIYKLHGSVPHAERKHVLANFAKESATQSAAVLLATDVAARGLNFVGVDWTVQYDPPCEVSDYVHRVGRVARAGKAGQSLLFLLPSEQAFLKVLEQKGVKNMIPLSLASTLNQAAKVCPAATQAGMEHAGGGRSGGRSDKHRDNSGSNDGSMNRNSRSGEAFCAEVQHRLEECVAQEDARVKAAFKETPKRKRGDKKKPEGELLQLARNAFLSHIRAYPTKEKCIKPIFSARALHLGHVARSFALKEPPKALASSKHRGGETIDPTDDTHAQQPSSMAFREFLEQNDGDNEAQSSRPATKRSKRGVSAGISRGERDANRVKHNKALLLANAAKMQSNGLDAL